MVVAVEWVVDPVVRAEWAEARPRAVAPPPAVDRHAAQAPVDSAAAAWAALVAVSRGREAWAPVADPVPAARVRVDPARRADRAPAVRVVARAAAEAPAAHVVVRAAAEAPVVRVPARAVAPSAAVERSPVVRRALARSGRAARSPAAAPGRVVARSRVAPARVAVVASRAAAPGNRRAANRPAAAPADRRSQRVAESVAAS